MAFRCAVVIRGIRRPLEIDFTSSIAEGSGVLLSVLIPTWAYVGHARNRIIKQIRKKTGVIDCFASILPIFGLKIMKNSLNSN